jgi:predicted dinucleotide-binding enzyme
MDVGILGSGDVARALGAGLLGHGYGVMLGSRSPDKLARWAAEHQGARTGTFAEAAAFGELVVLAVKGSAASAALREAGAEALAGKVVIDATNPIADAPPDDGVLRFFTTLDDSLMERLQRELPDVRFVKAFNSVGNALMIDPRLPGGRPTMFVCGDDAAAKAQVTELLAEVGWDAEDLGGVKAARAIEPLCILWCIPGFLRNDWMHAYKVLRPA